MELLLFENEKFKKMYNCTDFNVDVIPLEKRQNIPLGIFFITIGIIEEIIYIPCMIVIWRNMKHSCYKIMFYMGILDMLCLLVCAIATGWLCILGAVFCSYPTLIYWLGISINFFWPVESAVEILLAVNRCMEIYRPRFGLILFKGNRTWLWMIPITLYGVFTSLFMTAYMFNGIYSTWFFYPYFGYINDYNFQLQYMSVFHDAHDWVIAVTVPTMYLLLAIYLFVKNKSLNNESAQKKSIFCQVALISAINSVTSVMYIILQYSTDFSPLLAIVAHFFWMQVHGIPPVIYLLMNNSMREDSKKLMVNFMQGKCVMIRAFNISVTQNLQQILHRNRVHMQQTNT